MTGKKVTNIQWYDCVKWSNINRVLGYTRSWLRRDSKDPRIKNLEEKINEWLESTKN